LASNPEMREHNLSEMKTIHQESSNCQIFEWVTFPIWAVGGSEFWRKISGQIERKSSDHMLKVSLNIFGQSEAFQIRCLGSFFRNCLDWKLPDIKDAVDSLSVHLFCAENSKALWVCPKIQDVRCDSKNIHIFSDLKKIEKYWSSET
jgi:hypothetical protein